MLYKNFVILYKDFVIYNNKIFIF